MFRKLLLSLATVATVSTGLLITSGAAQADDWRWHHRWRQPGFSIHFGGPVWGGPYYQPMYRPVYQPVIWRPRCHATEIRFHHRWHRATICGGRIVRIW